MKKIFLFLFLPFVCFGQIKGNFYLSNTKIELNKTIIEYLTKNINKIVSIGGQVKYKIPYEKEFLLNTKSTYIDGFLCQYEKKLFLEDITIFKPKTKYIEFDFKSKKIIKDKNYLQNDNDDIFKPSDLKEKLIKEKLIKEKFKEEKP